MRTVLPALFANSTFAPMTCVIMGDESMRRFFSAGV